MKQEIKYELIGRGDCNTPCPHGKTVKQFFRDKEVIKKVGGMGCQCCECFCNIAEDKLIVTCDPEQTKELPPSEDEPEQQPKIDKKLIKRIPHRINVVRMQLWADVFAKWGEDKAEIAVETFDKRWNVRGEE
jgi:hypothetical protein